MGIDRFVRKAKTGTLLLASSEGFDAAIIKFFTASEKSHVGQIVCIEDGDGNVKKYLWHSPSEKLGGLPDMLSDPPREKSGPQLNDLRDSLVAFTQNSDITVRLIKHSSGSMHPWAVRPSGAVGMYSDLVEFMRSEHTKHYESSLTELLLSAYDGPGGMNTENLDEYFCSELVAETLKRGDVLCTTLPSNEFVPGDFSDAAYEKLRIARKIEYGREITIKRLM